MTEFEVQIPAVHWYGVEGEYNVMVIDLLGPSLEEHPGPLAPILAEPLGSWTRGFNMIQPPQVVKFCALYGSPV